MTAEVTEAPLDTAGLCAKYPQLAEPWPGWTCWTGWDGGWCATALPEFPAGWTAEWEAGVGADALAAERAHWEIVNGTVPPAHSLLPDEPVPPALYAVKDELEPLPEHGWLDRMATALADPDEKADAAVGRFSAIHDEQPPEDDDLGDDDEPEDVGEPAPDGSDSPSSDDEGTEVA